MSDKLLIGMLWFNNDPEMSLAAKVKGAADYYQRKYDIAPDICYVHPSASGESTPGIDLRKSRQVMTNYFWIGKGT